MSWDEWLLDAFKNWIDIHHKTAEFIFPWETITSSKRKIAKAVNFWVIYWISSFWLAKMIWISMKDAKTYITKFYESYPKVKSYLEETIKWCELNKYVETLFWRKRYINWINDLNKIIKSSAEREATNMPIQWTSADIIKIAMIEVYDFLEKWKFKSKMIMQVHDELVFDIFPWEEKVMKKNVKEIMENILKNKVITLKADVWEWKSWKEAK
jgi:DNA polymerase-1